jgi:hypothetical protein
MSPASGSVTGEVGEGHASHFLELPMCTFIFGGTPLARLTQGHCDCGTALASKRSPASIKARKIEVLRKRGWSEHRIERWVAQVKSDESRKEEESRAKDIPDLQHWLEWVQAQPKPVDLVVNEVGSRVEPDYNRVQEVPREDVDEDFLCDLEKGVLYRFT